MTNHKKECLFLNIKADRTNSRHNKQNLLFYYTEYVLQTLCYLRTQIGQEPKKGFLYF